MCWRSRAWVARGHCPPLRQLSQSEFKTWFAPLSGTSSLTLSHCRLSSELSKKKMKNSLISFVYWQVFKKAPVTSQTLSPDPTPSTHKRRKTLDGNTAVMRPFSSDHFNASEVKKLLSQSSPRDAQGMIPFIDVLIASLMFIYGRCPTILYFGLT